MPEKYAILGYPLKHTMSPPIHKRLFELSGKTADYDILELSQEELENNSKLLKSYRGYNITIPHKVEIIKYLTKMDESARKYNSVNCVANTYDESIGYNTDCIGFLRALEAENISLEGNILLLGLGGVGRMIAVEAILHGAYLTVAVRDTDYPEAVDTAKAISKKFNNNNIKVIRIAEISGGFNLMINATPVGMFPNIDLMPVSEDVLEHCDSVFDVIYNPVKTRLLKTAEGMGKKILGGMSMLVWQAVIAHEIWDGVVYKNEDIQKLISDMEDEVQKKF